MLALEHSYPDALPAGNEDGDMGTEADLPGAELWFCSPVSLRWCRRACRGVCLCVNPGGEILSVCVNSRELSVSLDSCSYRATAAGASVFGRNSQHRGLMGGYVCARVYYHTGRSHVCICWRARTPQ